MRLSPRHLTDLKKSGLSEETIDKAGIFSVPPADINLELGYNIPGLSSMYGLFYFKGFSRFKVFYENGNAEGKPKYLQRKGSGNRLYLPATLDREILKDTSKILSITEGEKKTLKAIQEGIPCIGLTGLWSWSDGTPEKNLLKDFDAIEWKGRNVNLVPDNDFRLPERAGDLERAVKMLAYRLIDRGANVSIVILPAGKVEPKGFDDYLCQHTVEDFMGLPLNPVITIDQQIKEATPENVNAVVREIDLVCRSISEKSAYLSILAKKLHIPRRDLKLDAHSAKRDRYAEVKAEAKVKLENGKHILSWDTGGISDLAGQLGPLLEATNRYYIRAGAVCEVNIKDNIPNIIMLRPAEMCSRFESFVTPIDEKGKVIRSTEQEAKLILCSEPLQKALPELHLVSPCAVLLEKNGNLFTITGYDRSSGIWASGKQPQAMSVETARDILNEILSDYKFVSPGDKARALAAIITPAIVFGKMISGRTPMATTEADDSQSGKGYFNKLVAAIYGQKVTTISQRKGGVGSMEEAISRALLSGAGFIALDNLRGKIDLPSLESLLTEDSYLCRVPYQGDLPIDPRRTNFMATSNRAEFTRDLSNRASIIRILKQPADYKFKSFPEGDLLDHVRGNQSSYLGAVFTIVKDWHAAGKLKNQEARHDFREWAATLDWICQNLLGTGPLMEGHQAAKERTANPALTWLRDVALLIINGGRAGKWLRAHEILDMLFDSEIEVPGLQPGESTEDEATRKRVLQAIGRKLGQVFKEDVLEVDNLKCARSVVWDDAWRKDVKTYSFEICAYGDDFCAYSAPNAAPKETLAAPNAPNTFQHFELNKKKREGEDINKYIYAEKVSEPLGAIGAHRRIGADSTQPESEQNNNLYEGTI